MQDEEEEIIEETEEEQKTVRNEAEFQSNPQKQVKRPPNLEEIAKNAKLNKEFGNSLGRAFHSHPLNEIEKKKALNIEQSINSS